PPSAPHSHRLSLLLVRRPPPRPTLFPYTTLFRSRERRLNEAIAEMQKAIALAPTRGDAFYDLALLQSQANLPDAAETNYKKAIEDRKSTRLNSSHDQISYAVFCLKKKKRGSSRGR